MDHGLRPFGFEPQGRRPLRSRPTHYEWVQELFGTVGLRLGEGEKPRDCWVPTRPTPLVGWAELVKIG